MALAGCFLEPKPVCYGTCQWPRFNVLNAAESELVQLPGASSVFGLSVRGRYLDRETRPGPSSADESHTYTGWAEVAAPTRADRSVSADGSNSMSIRAPAVVSPLRSGGRMRSHEPVIAPPNATAVAWNRVNHGASAPPRARKASSNTCVAQSSPARLRSKTSWTSRPGVLVTSGPAR